MRWRILRWTVAASVIVLIGIAALAYRPAIAPVAPLPAASFTDDQVAWGGRLAAAGNCASCHTDAGGAPFAGGLGLATPFGTIYSTNITPDIATGIGSWSGAAFRRALREGISRDGTQLLPAFPYTHFTKLTDGDISALYAYLMTRTPVHAEPKRNTLPFPFNVRMLQAGWKLLFFSRGVFQPVADKSSTWNRGAYLVEGLTHCGACHTPLNALGAERAGAPYRGRMVDEWLAPALDAHSPAPRPWTEDDLFEFLRTGVSIHHGVALGPMSEVVHANLASLADSDIRAVATYFADMNGSAHRTAEALASLTDTSQPPAAGEHRHGEMLYLAACSPCHYNTSQNPPAIRPQLAFSTKLSAPVPNNLVHVLLEGVGTRQGEPGAFMPPYVTWSDSDLTALAGYLRSSRSTQAPWPHLLSQFHAARVRQTARELPQTGDHE